MIKKKIWGIIRILRPEISLFGMLCVYIGAIASGLNLFSPELLYGMLAVFFIGAGSIIASRGDVKGLTTAASLWVVAAIGLMVGFGIYILPVIATILVFVVLRLARIEKKKVA